MKKYFYPIALVILICFTSTSISQPVNYNGWFYINPLPGSLPLNSIQFTTLTTGYAVGLKNNIVRTTDGGINWQLDYNILNYPLLNGLTPLQSVYFVNQFTGYTTGVDGTSLQSILKTTDGGMNWNYISTVTGGNSVFFVDANTGFIAGSVDGRHISKTTDGGFIWSDYYAGNYVLTSNYFVSHDTGYTVGWTMGGVIFKTTNCGVNWQMNVINNGGFLCVRFLNERIGFLGASDGVYKTSNSGLDWTKIGDFIGSANSVFFTDTAVGFTAVVGGNPGVYKTSNGGLNWQRTTNEIDMKSVFFVNNNTGYATSAIGDIYYTSDAGGTWLNQKKDFTGLSTSLTTVEFTDENTGYTGDLSGNIYKTTDAGASWKDIWLGPIPDYHPIERIHFINANTGFVAADSLTIMKTTNAGLNWTVTHPPAQTNYDINDLWFVNSQTGYAAGSGYYEPGQLILKTTNNGDNWFKLVDNPTGHMLFTITFTDSLTGYAAGEPAMFKTTNAGANWVQYNNLPYNGGWIPRIRFINSNTGFMTVMGGLNASILRTTNAGNNWQLADSVYSDAYGIAFVNQNTGYCSGSGYVLKTVNGGANWYFLNNGTFWNNLYDISFTSELTGYAVGENGTALKTTTGGGNIIGVEPVSNEIPKQFNLYQNYPNPFNPATKIKFDLPALKLREAGIPVKLIIYDITGRQVATLFDRHVQPGTYEVEWDAANYASGIYFYSLISGDYRESKKMVLIK